MPCHGFNAQALACMRLTTPKLEAKYPSDADEHFEEVRVDIIFQYISWALILNWVIHNPFLKLIDTDRSFPIPGIAAIQRFSWPLSIREIVTLLLYIYILYIHGYITYRH